MSDINLEFTVSNNSIEFTVDPIDLTFTPEDIQLTINPSYSPGAGGNVGELQYNNGSLLAGIPTATYTGGNLALGNVANLKITGGTNGYVLQTDGAGNLAWTAQTGGGGNGSPGGSNTQIQYNDNGLFGGNTGFTFNEVTGNVNIPGNLIVAGNFNASVANSNYANFAGNVVNSSQPNITSVGTLTSLAVSGNISGQSFLGSLGNLPYGIENIALIGAQTGTYNMDLITNAIKYSTANATGNIILNFRGNSTISANTLLGNGQSIIGTYVMTNGTTPYGISSIQIDGVSQTIKWAGGLVPVNYANTLVSSTFTIIKTSTTPTYTVLGSSTRYN